jgi:hypothetical protein
MRVHINVKLLLLQIGALVLVMWVDTAWVDALFMAYIVWDLWRWGHTNPPVERLRGPVDIRQQSKRG